MDFVCRLKYQLWNFHKCSLFVDLQVSSEFDDFSIGIHSVICFWLKNESRSSLNVPLRKNQILAFLELLYTGETSVGIRQSAEFENFLLSIGIQPVSLMEETPSIHFVLEDHNRLIAEHLNHLYTTGSEGDFCFVDEKSNCCYAHTAIFGALSKKFVCLYKIRSFPRNKISVFIESFSVEQVKKLIRNIYCVLDDIPINDDVITMKEILGLNWTNIIISAPNDCGLDVQLPDCDWFDWEVMELEENRISSKCYLWLDNFCYITYSEAVRSHCPYLSQCYSSTPFMNSDFVVIANTLNAEEFLAVAEFINSGETSLLFTENGLCGSVVRWLGLESQVKQYNDLNQEFELKNQVENENKNCEHRTDYWKSSNNHFMEDCKFEVQTSPTEISLDQFSTGNMLISNQAVSLNSSFKSRSEIKTKRIPAVPIHCGNLCEICSMKFISYSSLLRHKKWAHIDQ